jgi:iron(III) transport system permease protein
VEVTRPSTGGSDQPEALRRLGLIRRLSDRLELTSGPPGWTVFALGVAGVIALPIVALASKAFAAWSPTLGHLWQTVLPAALANTLALMLIVGIGTAIVGVGSAWLVARYLFPGCRTLQWLLLLPLAMPAYIVGYAYADATTFAGPMQTSLRSAFGWSKGEYWFPEAEGVFGAGLMFVFVLYPYVYYLARAAFLEQSTSADEVARTFGYTRLQRFALVAVPLAAPAISAGVALALMETLADFGTVQYFGVQTFTTLIFRTWFGMGDLAGAAQLSLALLAMVAIVMIVERRATAQRRVDAIGRRFNHIVPQQLSGWRAVAALGAGLVPVVLGFLIPVVLLIRLHGIGGDDVFRPGFLRLTANSIGLAAATALFLVALATGLAFGVRLARTPTISFAVRSVALGYAVPGTVVAIGVIVGLGAIDHALRQTIQALGAGSVGLIFSGSIVALLFAYAVRFLAVAHEAVAAGYGRLSVSLDHAARSLGRTPMEVLRDVHAPLLSRTWLTAIVLVFADVLKELPATLIVRPFNFETLAVRVYQLASDERLATASTGALVIVACGLLPVIVLTRLSDTDRQRLPQEPR